MTIFGHFDIAQLVLYLFWAFFAGLIIYLQRETMREGYPLESEVTGRPAMFGPFTQPAPKTFLLPHGHGQVTVPDRARDAREITDRRLAMRATAKWSGSPFEPTGDPLVDGVGPAAWAERADHPELTVEGETKIVPLSSSNEWSIADGDNDIRGWKVVACDGASPGAIRDLWIDKSESMIRYIEIALDGGGTVLCPMTAVVVGAGPSKGMVRVASLAAAQFANIPKIATPGQITMLEEEKVMAYVAGGRLYATPDRLGPLL